MRMLRACHRRCISRLVLAVALCATQSGRAAEPLPVVVSSIRPLHLILIALAADLVDAREFPGIGASPHDFVPRPSAIALLASARVVFWIGPELERPLAELLERMPARHDLALLPMLPPGEIAADADPHVWLDPRLAAAIADAVSAALIARGIIDESQMQPRLEAFAASMRAAERNMRRELSGLEQVPFMVMHDGYGYFVRRFGLNQVLALGPDAEHQPGARSVSRMRHQAYAGGAQCLLRESNSNRRLAEMLADGTAIRIREVDPLALTAAADATGFATFLRDFAATVAGCLRGPPA
jgi:zinc transport system substrate-binding protein